MIAFRLLSGPSLLLLALATACTPTPTKSAPDGTGGAGAADGAARAGDAGSAPAADAVRATAGDAGAAADAGAADPGCKVHAGGKCCLPEVTASLPKETVFAACKGAEAAYQGERKTRDGCRYVFAKEGVKPEDTTVELTLSKLKNVPDSPTDPFFKWKKAGKAYYTDKAASPKSAPMLARSTGIFLAGPGTVLSVTVPTQICPAAQVKKLAAKLK